MNKLDIFKTLKENTDSDKAKQMERYMRNKFLFYGIQAPQRKEITKSYFKTLKKESSIDWSFINACWEDPCRESQYIGIDYLKMMKKYLVLEDVTKLKRIITEKSWWDTVDGLHRIVGDLVFKYPELNKIMLVWSVDENIWLRRIAINHQMFRKDKMNLPLFEEILINNLKNKEFFINKAIGWALRDYSKTNPNWVAEFLKRNQAELASISIREGSKYIYKPTRLH